MPSGIYKRIDKRIKRNCIICNGEIFTTLVKNQILCSNPCKNIYKGICNRKTGNKPPSRKGQPWPHGQYEKFKISNSGEKNWNWHGGIGRWRPRNREWNEWRKRVFERDNYTCVQCSIKGGKLEAHHIQGWKDRPALRYDINNGLTLCRICHMKTPQWGQRGRSREMEKIGGLWKRITKKGEDYFSGVIGGKNVLIFKNTRKQVGDKYPDYEVFNPSQKDELPPKKEDASDVPF